jgi:hypothetical protein
MWLRIALRFPVGFLDGRDCAWRVHSGSLTQARPQVGQERLEFIDYALAMVERELPAALPSPSALARRRSFWAIKAALDALDNGEPRRALGLLRAAVRERPRALLDPRVLLAGLGVLVGARGRERLARLRAWRMRAGLQRGFEGPAAEGSAPKR